MADPISSQPTIFLENQADQFVSASLLSLAITLGKNGRGSGDLELNNWGIKNNAPGYLFLDDPRLAFGKPLQIKVGELVLLAGRISEINPHYWQGKLPTIGLAVSMDQPADITGQAPPAVRLSYLQELREFDIKETYLARRMPKRSREIRYLSGIGIADFTGQLVPGLKVDLEGLGARYSGEYTLTEVTHTFDKVMGLRTHFAAERME